MSNLVRIICFPSKVLHSLKSLTFISLVTLMTVCFIVWIWQQVKSYPWTDFGCRSGSIAQEISDIPLPAVDGHGHQCTVFEYDATINNKSVRGRPFIVDARALSNIGFPIDLGEDLSQDDVHDFVIVIAADYNYFHIAMDAIGLIQLHLPTHKVLFYDLSHELTSVAVIEKVNRLCNVEYVAFNYSLYPRHVRNLINYAWKPLIIHEVLRKHRAVLWMDSSGRVHKGDWNGMVHGALSKGGITMLEPTGHSIFAATHSGLYNYLPLGRLDAIQTKMGGACTMFIYLNRENYASVISWSVLCALVADCIAPTTDLYCKFAKGVDRDSTYAKCHRYDQSVFNVLLLNRLKQKLTDDKTTIGDFSKQYMVEAPLSVVKRERLNAPLLTCSDNGLVATPRGHVLHVDDYFPLEILYKISALIAHFL